MGRPDFTGSVVYFIGATRGPIKIGVTKDVRKRLRNMQTGSGLKLSILATAPGSYALEKHYHRMFAEYHEHGEWFRRNPALTAEIKRLKKLDGGIYESRALVEEKERLRKEWNDAIARRNSLAGAGRASA